MKRLTILFAVLAVFLWVGSAAAYDFGSNITIYDKRGYLGSGQGNEDQETEPLMINNQYWDLEGFFLNGTTLTMVGGFDFFNGHTYKDHTYHGGDIFIDVDGDAQFGEGQDQSVENYGYDYAIKMNYAYKIYSVFQLSEDSTFTDVIEGLNNPMSNPWLYAGGDTVMSGYDALSFTGYGSLLTDEDTGFVGGDHYFVSVDLGFLSPDQLDQFIVHSTIECGNDNLMGSVPEPATMLLVGFGLLGIAFVGRKNVIKR